MSLSLNSEQLKIFNKYKNDAMKVVNSHTNPTFRQTHRVDVDELAQYALIGLIKGIKTYDPTKGTKPSTHYYQSMQWEMHKSIREISLGAINKYTLEVPKTVWLDNPETEQMQENFVDNYEYELIDNLEIDYERLESLSEHLPSIIDYRLQGYSFREIGKKLGLSHSTVSRLVSQNEKDIKECIVMGNGVSL